MYGPVKSPFVCILQIYLGPICVYTPNIFTGPCLLLLLLLLLASINTHPTDWKSLVFASESIFLASDDLILSIAVFVCVRLNYLWLIGVVRMCLRKLVSV